MSAAPVANPQRPSSERYQGKGSTMMVAGVIGGGGLLGTALLYFAHGGDPEAARLTLASYLTGFVYWLGICVAALIWLCIFHASNARWPTVVRRPLEVMGAAAPLFLVLSLPIIFGAHTLFDWVDPSAHHFTGEQLKLLAHKRPYLNTPFFIIRWVIYFIVWIGVGRTQLAWSLRQDETGDVKLLDKMRTLGPGALPFLGLTITFAAFDWLMSLDAFWGSTIFGAYYFAGSFVAAMSLLALVTLRSNRSGLFGALVTRHHLHNLGKLMFAFIALWAYVAFSQFMLIWIANLPEEGEWYVVRMMGGWQVIGILLLVGHFVFPFFFLLSRATKFRAGPLAFAAVWILCIHLLDLMWLVMPAIHQPHLTASSFFQTVLAWVGVGGVSVAFALWTARGRYTVPVKDPFLEDSLRYVQP